MWLNKRETDKWLKKKDIWCLLCKKAQCMLPGCVSYSLYIKEEEILCWIKPGRGTLYRADIKGFRVLVADNDLDVLKLKCAIILEDMNLAF